MKNRFGIACLIGVIACMAIISGAGDVTPLYTPMCHDIGMTNGEQVLNLLDGVLGIRFDDDAAVLGTLRLDSSVDGTNIAAGDEMVLQVQLENSTSTVVTTHSIVFDFTDETGGTEDGTVFVNCMLNGTLTTIATIDASGITVGAGSFVGNSSGLTNIPAANLTGTIAALDGSAITDLDAGNITAATVLTAVDINAGTNINGANIAIGSDVSINALTLADLLTLPVNTQVVTNGQLLVALDPGVNNIDPTDEASGGTCTVTIGAGAPGAFYAVANASTDTNKLAIAQAGFWTGPAIELEVGDPMIVFYGATNKVYGIEQ